MSGKADSEDLMLSLHQVFHISLSCYYISEITVRQHIRQSFNMI